MNRAARIENVNLTALREAGIQALLLDADNTLSLWNKPTPETGAAHFIEQAKAEGFLCMIASNAGEERLRPLSEALEIPFMHRCMKPLPFGLLRASKKLGVPIRRCAMIGDQLLTDMPAALLCGARRVLLDPIDTSHEFKGTHINRRIETLLKRVFRI